MKRGIEIHYKMIEDYYNVWTGWIEILLEEGYYKDALIIVKHIIYKKRSHAENEEQQRIRNFE